MVAELRVFGCRSLGLMRVSAGFTMVELIVVLLLVAILGAVGLPRFKSGTEVDTRGSADRLQTMFRYAQKTAIASRRNVCVVIASSVASISIAASVGASVACTLDVKDPADDPDDNVSNPSNIYRLTLPSGVTLTPTTQTITFDAQGRPGLASKLTVTVTGVDSSRVFYVEPETGYVHE